MNRREFLRRALSLAPAAIVLPSAVSYFLPPRGGWLSDSDKALRYMGVPILFDEAESDGDHTIIELIQRRMNEALNLDVDRMVLQIYNSAPSMSRILRQHSLLVRE